MKQKPSQTIRGQSGTDHEATRFERLAGARERDVAVMSRVTAAEEHVRAGTHRDEQANRRDAAALTRDRASGKRDLKMAISLGRSLTKGRTSVDRVLACVEALRLEAEADRACAADDREQAAEDRARAAEERAEALEALRGAHMDELTGAYRRGLGKDMFRAEIDRARRSGSRLAMVIVDVDGLKDVNDAQGHLAGDELLCGVVAAIRANIRSYEPVVRLGGDEFAFTMAGVSPQGAVERCELMREEVTRAPVPGTFTVGIAELRRDDELGDLLGRADAALLKSGHRRRRRFRFSGAESVADRI